ncbi:MAG: hypothetical protein JWO50_308 [Candidatus Kaiserbacteria bacterium]|nr:hypothetical protein [Candidatus Kaiserbacteria bacterium]
MRQQSLLKRLKTTCHTISNQIFACIVSSDVVRRRSCFLYKLWYYPRVQLGTTEQVSVTDGHALFNTGNIPMQTASHTTASKGKVALTSADRIAMMQKIFGTKEAPRKFHGTTAAGEEVKSAKTSYGSASDKISILGENGAVVELSPNEFEIMARDALKGFGYKVYLSKNGAKR